MLTVGEKEIEGDAEAGTLSEMESDMAVDCVAAKGPREAEARTRVGETDKVADVAADLEAERLELWSGLCVGEREGERVCDGDLEGDGEPDGLGLAEGDLDGTDERVSEGEVEGDLDADGVRETVTLEEGHRVALEHAESLGERELELVAEARML